MARSKGAIALARKGITQTDIHSKLRVSNAIVSLWMTGKRTPSPDNRDHIFRAYGIPQEDWDSEPDAKPMARATPTPTIPPAPVASSPVVAEMTLETTQNHISDLETMVKDLMASAKTDTSMTPLEQGKVMASLATTLGKVLRMKGEEVAEIRVMRHPKFQNLKDAILGALAPHPAALRDVLAAIADEETSAF